MMPLQIRRGTTAQRLTITPLPGEPIFDTTLNQIFVGDGVTAGGQAPTISSLVSEQAIDAVGEALVNGTHKNINFIYGTAQDNLDRIDAEVDLSNYEGEIVASAFRGSVFADDSGIIVDSSNKNITANNITAVSIDTGSISISGSFFVENIESNLKGSVFADNSTLLINGIEGSINLDGTVKGNIIPDSDELYDIGSPSNKFRDLYLSGTSLNLGSAQITAVGSAIELPAGSTVAGIPIGTGTGSGDGVIEGSTYKINIAADDSSIMVDTDLETVTASGGFFGDVNANTISTQFIDGENSSEVEVRTSMRVKSDLIIENELIILNTLPTNIPNLLSSDISSVEITAGNIFSNNLSANNFSSGIINARFIDPIDSSEVEIRGALRVTSDLIVENELIFNGSFQINIPDLVSVDITTANITAGDIFSNNFSANNFSSGIINARFIDPIDPINSSEVEIRGALRVTSDLIVENEISAPIRILTNEIQPFIGTSIDLNSEIRVKDLLTIQNNIDNNNSIISLIKHTSSNFGSRMTMFRSKGTESSPSAVSQNDILSVISSGGYDGSDYIAGASITVTAEGSVSAGIMPSSIIFSTMNNAGVFANRGKFNSDGLLELYLPMLIQRTNVFLDFMVLQTFSNNPVEVPNISFSRARGTISSPVAAGSSDPIIDLAAAGFDGSTYIGSSTIRMSVDGSVSPGIVPGRIEFWTTDLSGVQARKAQFNKDGILEVDTIKGFNSTLNVIGDLIGSVFSDASTMIIDGTDGSVRYYPGTPGDWNGTAPTTVGEALDRLATLVKTLNSGTGA
jgi:hypothetical protein